MKTLPGFLRRFFLLRSARKMKPQQDSRLFRLVSRFLKYFLLILFGFAIAYVASMTFGATKLAIMLSPIVFAGLWRLGLILLCLVATTVIFESFR
jgi:hypothetical protein